MKSDDPRHTREYQRKRAAFRAAAADLTPCALCGRPIDKTLPATHPWGPTIEHTVPVRLRPDLALDTSLWRLAHRKCQGRQGAAHTNARRVNPPAAPQRDW